MNGTVTLLLGQLLVAATLTTPLATSISIGPATIVLEQSTFATVARRLGKAALAHRGDAGDSRVQACYMTAGPAPTTYYLESGEMGGGDHILQVDVIGPGGSIASEEPIIADRCTTLHAVAGAATDRGLRLGMTRSEVERRLHAHGREHAGVTVYEKEEKRREGSRSVDVTSWVRVRYVRGRVAAFSVGLVSST